MLGTLFITPFLSLLMLESFFIKKLNNSYTGTKKKNLTLFFTVNLFFVFIFSSFLIMEIPGMYKTIVPVVVSYYLFKNKNLVIFNLIILFIFLNKSCSFTIIDIFISFEVFFIFIAGNVIINTFYLKNYERLSYAINIIKWNVPSTVLGLFLINASVFNNPLINNFNILSNCTYNNTSIKLGLLSYFFIKSFLWSLYFYKYKLYVFSNVELLFFIFFNYFVVLQQIIIPLLLLVKNSTNLVYFEGTVFVLIFSIPLILMIQKIYKPEHFIFLTTLVTYLNFFFILLY